MNTNEAVLNLMEMAILTCKRQNKYVEICDQAPSNYTETIQWLVKYGIDSLSLNPDSPEVVLDIKTQIQENTLA